jgi:membrane-bound lytic murein transglycosylase A
MAKLRNWALSALLVGLVSLPLGIETEAKSLVRISQLEATGLVDDLIESDRPALLAAIDYSLKYIRTPTAVKRYPVDGISRLRMEKSLVRFRYLVQTAPTALDLDNAVRKEFSFYKSIGLDRKGTVQFTGYYEAVYPASRTKTEVYQYPIYKLPPNFRSWTSPHPTRADLENGDRLQGLELAWLSDRFQAFLLHVQGSARLQLTDGTTLTVGYAGKNDQPYISVGAEIVKDGKMKLEEVTLPRLISYFQANPQDLNQYLQRNPSFVFFRETFMRPATGNIGVPVTAERSIATDKSLMPPGAIALINTTIPIVEDGQLVPRQIRRFVLDQDTGGAIKGAGRVDIFMGTGQIAKDRAGLINNDGELYYLVLK